MMSMPNLVRCVNIPWMGGRVGTNWPTVNYVHCSCVGGLGEEERKKPRLFHGSWGAGYADQRAGIRWFLFVIQAVFYAEMVI